MTMTVVNFDVSFCNDSVMGLYCLVEVENTFCSILFDLFILVSLFNLAIVWSCHLIIHIIEMSKYIFCYMWLGYVLAHVFEHVY